MSEVLWWVSRAAGVVSIVLLTVVVALGAVTTGHRRPHGTRSTLVVALHRGLGLGLVVFLAAHVVTAVVDSYVSIGWLAVVVPFTAGYQTAWVGLGTVALDVLLAVVATSCLRRRISERVWRAVHLTGYALWPLAVVHGIALGTADEPVLLAVSIGCAGVGALALAWRLQARPHDQDRRAAVAAQVWS